VLASRSGDDQQRGTVAEVPLEAVGPQMGIDGVRDTPSRVANQELVDNQVRCRTEAGFLLVPAQVS